MTKLEGEHIKSVCNPEEHHMFSKGPFETTMSPKSP